MQAFRHLYVLSAEPRSLDAIDVDTKQRVYVPLSGEQCCGCRRMALGPCSRSRVHALAGLLWPATCVMDTHRLPWDVLPCLACPAVCLSEACLPPGTPNHVGNSLRPVTSASKGAADVVAGAAREAAGLAGPGTRAGSPGAGGEGGAAVCFQRVAPCLLPEQQQVASVRVTGPRYWNQLLEAGRRRRGTGLEGLYASRTLFVQASAASGLPTACLAPTAGSVLPP